MALSFKMMKQPRVAVGFMGDGATNEGAFHEAVNMAAIWDLPVLFVVENNLYGASTPVAMVVKTKHISDRACAYGIPGLTIDGNDVLAVFEATREALDRARDGQGPHASGAADLPDHRPLAARPVPLPAGRREEEGIGERTNREVCPAPSGAGDRGPDGAWRG